MAGPEEIRLPVRVRLRRRVGRHPLGERPLHAFAIGRSPRQWLLRKRLARSVGSSGSEVPRARGYRYFEPGELRGSDAALRRAQEVARRFEPHFGEMASHQPGRFRIVFDLLSDDQLAEAPELVSFFLEQQLTEAAVHYLRTIPVLRRIGLGLALGSRRVRPPFGSQLWHLDGDDGVQLKFLMAVEEIGAHDGPLTFLPADTQRVVRQLGPPVSGSYATYDDQEVLAHVAQDELLTLEGPPGRALLLDTSRCLHFGSRVPPGTPQARAGVFPPHPLLHPGPAARAQRWPQGPGTMPR